MVPGSLLGKGRDSRRVSSGTTSAAAAAAGPQFPPPTTTRPAVETEDLNYFPRPIVEAHQHQHHGQRHRHHPQQHQEHQHQLGQGQQQHPSRLISAPDPSAPTAEFSREERQRRLWEEQKRREQKLWEDRKKKKFSKKKKSGGKAKEDKASKIWEEEKGKEQRLWEERKRRKRRKEEEERNNSLEVGLPRSMLRLLPSSARVIGLRPLRPIKTRQGSGRHHVMTLSDYLADFPSSGDGGGGDRRRPHAFIPVELSGGHADMVEALARGGKDRAELHSRGKEFFKELDKAMAAR